MERSIFSFEFHDKDYSGSFQILAPNEFHVFIIDSNNLGLPYPLILTVANHELHFQVNTDNKLKEVIIEAIEKKCAEENISI